VSFHDGSIARGSSTGVRAGTATAGTSGMQMSTRGGVEVCQFTESGTGFALPSQTLYFGRDDGLDPEQFRAAEAQVRSWRDQGQLPFPDFAPEQKKPLRESLVFSPKGSPVST
jgi:hypothetical protein